jgi:hypothetical protein
MFEFRKIPPGKATEQELASLRVELSEEESRATSLEWLQELHRRLKPAMRLKVKDARTLHLQEVYRLADAALSLAVESEADPRLVRMCYRLGCMTQLVFLSNAFDGMVSTARAVKRASKNKGEVSILDARQQAKVHQFIKRRMSSGVTQSEACRQASRQLKTGTFRGLPGLRVDIGFEALRKQIRKHK